MICYPVFLLQSQYLVLNPFPSRFWPWDKAKPDLGCYELGVSPISRVAGTAISWVNEKLKRDNLLKLHFSIHLFVSD